MVVDDRSKDYGLVSIITSCYNSGPFIAQTIQSVQAQTYCNWELLITDDCSTDDSCDIIEKYAKKDNRIKLFRFKENQGSGATRNWSIHEAKGRFMAFCDSDDLWTPDKLERQLEFMVKNNVALSYTSYYKIDEKGAVYGFVKCPVKINRQNIIRDDELGCLTAIYDVDKIGKYYMPIIRRRQDWCLWIDIISKTGPAYGLQAPLAYYRNRRDSISWNKFKLVKYNFAVYNNFLDFNFIKSAFFMGFKFFPHYAYKKIKQKLLDKKHLKEFPPC